MKMVLSIRQWGIRTAGITILAEIQDIHVYQEGLAMSLWSLLNIWSKTDKVRIYADDTGGSDGMPHGTNKSDLSGYAAKLDELIGKLQAELDNKWNARCAIKDVIEKLPDETEKAVLNFRYINGWKWERIAEELFYTYQHVHKIHSKALMSLEIN